MDSGVTIHEGKTEGNLEEIRAASRRRTLAIREEQKRRNAEARARKAERRCLPEQRRCPAAHDLRTFTPECCREHRREVLRRLVPLLEDAGIVWWLDYGAALGAARHEGKAVPWDKDEDAGILASDARKLLELKPKILEAGLWFIHFEPQGSDLFDGGDSFKIRRSRKNQNNIDFFVWYPAENGYLQRKRYIEDDRYKGRELDPELLFPIELVEYDGVPGVPVPANLEGVAELRYGDAWMLPVFDSHDGVER